MSGLKIFTGNKLETLAGRLARVLASQPPDALEPEVIVVRSLGMERWVSMELARRLGICANCSFPFPNSFVRDIFGRVLPGITEEQKSFFDPGVMALKIMQLLPGMLERPAFSGLRAYLGRERLGLKSIQLASRIARVFDQYQLYRPQMILDWNRGNPGPGGRSQPWQFELWREITANHRGLDRAGLREKFFAWAGNPTRTRENLPSRVCVFGISSLPRFHLEIFAALARLTEVNLFLVKPFLQADLPDDTAGGPPGNRLLDYMGTQGREFYRLNRDLAGTAGDLSVAPGESTLLACLQSDILENRSRDGVSVERKTIGERDDSLQVHVCHSALREIEVLRDSLLAMFDRDPGLSPRDILVMTPQVETYAPYIQAVLDTPDRERIPYSIADRSLRRGSPAAEAFLAMLELAGGRYEASRVLGLLETAEVARKFSLTDADLDLVRRWVGQTRIKWGIDAGHRRSLGLPEFEENTWRAGLDRLLLGYAMSGEGERMFRGILPYEGFESARARVLGGLLEFTGRLFSRLEALKEPRSLGEWADCLAGLLEGFFEPGDDSEGELQWIRETLGRMAADAGAAGFGEKVGLEVARHCLARRLEERVSAYGFITGGVTFCSMVPMRSIGFKVICLVGINDEAFPRRSESAGFDLMVLDPRPGDPSRRNEDRYLFLEAVLSAREKLHLSYVGRSDQDNVSIPPSVVVSELLDYVERGFSHPTQEILGHVVTRHRLQPFHPDYFSGATGLFSYSAENCRTAARSLRPRDPAAKFIPSSLPAPGEEWNTVEVEDLCAFLVNPARFLLTRRLGIYLEEGDKAPEDREAFSLVQLERYRLKDELAAKGLRGLDLAAFYEPARAAGRLPHGTVGRYFYRLTSEEVEKFLDGIREFRSLEPLSPLEVDLDLDGCRVVGRLTEIYPEALLRFRPGAVRPADRLRTWVSHLLLGAVKPEGYPGTSIFSGHDLQCRYSPFEDCRQVLAGLVRCYRQGLARPWKLFPTASWSFARAVVIQQKSEDKARHEALADWQGGDYSRGDCRDPYLELCFGRAGSPLDREFCQASLEVYRPLLEHQQETRL